MQNLQRKIRNSEPGRNVAIPNSEKMRENGFCWLRRLGEVTAACCGHRRTRWWCRCRTCPLGGAGRRGAQGGRTAETNTMIKPFTFLIIWEICYLFMFILPRNVDFYFSFLMR